MKLSTHRFLYGLLFHVVAILPSRCGNPVLFSNINCKSSVRKSYLLSFQHLVSIFFCRSPSSVFRGVWAGVVESSELKPVRMRPPFGLVLEESIKGIPARISANAHVGTFARGGSGCCSLLHCSPARIDASSVHAVSDILWPTLPEASARHNAAVNYSVSVDGFFCPAVASHNYRWPSPLPPSTCSDSGVSYHDKYKPTESRVWGNVFHWTTIKQRSCLGKKGEGQALADAALIARFGEAKA